MDHGNGYGFVSSEAWPQIPALPCISCVTPGKSLNLSGTRSPHLKMWLRTAATSLGTGGQHTGAVVAEGLRAQPQPIAPCSLSHDAEGSTLQSEPRDQPHGTAPALSRGWGWGAPWDSAWPATSIPAPWRPSHLLPQVTPDWRPQAGRALRLGHCWGPIAVSRLRVGPSWLGPAQSLHLLSPPTSCL